MLNDGIFVPSLSENSGTLKCLTFGYYSVVANLPPDTLNLDVSRDKLINFAPNVNWESITQAFEKLRRNVSEDEVLAPYYLMQMLYDYERYSEEKLTFLFDREKELITVTLRNSPKEIIADSINSFLNYLSNDLYNQSNNLPELQWGDMENKPGSRSYPVFLALYSNISCAQNMGVAQAINVNAQSREYNSTILDGLLKQKTPLHSKLVNIANEIMRLHRQHGNTNNFKSAMKALIAKEDSYFRTFSSATKSNLTNKFLDKRYSSYDFERNQSAQCVEKIIFTPDSPQRFLNDFLKSYFQRTYASIRSDKKISLAEIAGITVAAVYSLMDFVSVIYSYQEIKDGVCFTIARKDLEPKPEWFKELQC